MKDAISFPFPKEMSNPIDWDACYTELLPKVFNYFIYKTGNPEVAEELTSETFQRVWQARNRYRHDQSKLTTWIFGFAKKIFLEYLRSQKRNRHIALDESLRYGEQSLERTLIQNEEKRWLRQMLNQISDRERDLISLKYGAGLTNRDIAKLTHFSESNVGTILQRCINKLKKSKEEYDGR